MINLGSLSLHDSIKLALKDYEWVDYDVLLENSNKIWEESKNKEDKQQKVIDKEDEDALDGTYVTPVTKSSFNKQINVLLKEKAIAIKRELINPKPEEWNSELDKPKYSFILCENIYKSIIKNFNPKELADNLKLNLEKYSISVNKSNKSDLKNNKISNLLLKLPCKFTLNPDNHKIEIDVYKCNNPTEAYNLFKNKTTFRNNASYANMKSKYQSNIEDKFSFAIYEIYTNEDDLFYTYDIFDELKYLKYTILAYNMVFCIYSNSEKEYNVVIQLGKLIAEYLESIK